MSSPVNFWEAVHEIRTGDGRYARDAYGFVMDALEYTIQHLGEARHISARELLIGMCRFAQEHYGVMSYSMLERWGVTTTSDIGNFVFHLLDTGVLSKQDEDDRADFDDVLDLRAELEEGYFDK